MNAMVPNGSPVTPEAGGAWTTFLSSPENRAALLSFGTSLLGAPTSGSLAGQIGNAVAAGSEARDKNIIQQQKVAESQAEIDDAAEGREIQRGQLAVAQGNQATNQYEAQTGRMNAETLRKNAAAGEGGMSQKDLTRLYLQFALKLEGEANATGTEAPTREAVDQAWTARTGLPSPIRSSTPGAASVAGGGFPTPTPEDILKLKQRPELGPKFDSLYGPGSSKAVLGG